MDENTRAIVASNLTAAYYARKAQEKTSPPGQKKATTQDKRIAAAVGVYKKFLSRPELL
jgi:hypothetical protein